MLNFCDFIGVYVFYTNHHLNVWNFNETLTNDFFSFEQPGPDDQLLNKYTVRPQYLEQDISNYTLVSNTILWTHCPFSITFQRLISQTTPWYQILYYGRIAHFPLLFNAWYLKLHPGIKYYTMDTLPIFHYFSTPDISNYTKVSNTILWTHCPFSFTFQHLISQSTPWYQILYYGHIAHFPLLFNAWYLKLHPGIKYYTMDTLPIFHYFSTPDISNYTLVSNTILWTHCPFFITFQRLISQSTPWYQILYYGHIAHFPLLFNAWYLKLFPGIKYYTMDTLPIFHYFSTPDISKYTLVSNTILWTHCPFSITFQRLISQTTPWYQILYYGHIAYFSLLFKAWYLKLYPGIKYYTMDTLPIFHYFSTPDISKYTLVSNTILWTHCPFSFTFQHLISQSTPWYQILYYGHIAHFPLLFNAWYLKLHPGIKYYTMDTLPIFLLLFNAWYLKLHPGVKYYTMDTLPIFFYFSTPDISNYTLVSNTILWTHCPFSITFQRLISQTTPWYQILYYGHIANFPLLFNAWYLKEHPGIKYYTMDTLPIFLYFSTPDISNYTLVSNTILWTHCPFSFTFQRLISQTIPRYQILYFGHIAHFPLLFNTWYLKVHPGIKYYTRDILPIFLYFSTPDISNYTLVSNTILWTHSPFFLYFSTPDISNYTLVSNTILWTHCPFSFTFQRLISQTKPWYQILYYGHIAHFPLLFNAWYLKQNPDIKYYTMDTLPIFSVSQTTPWYQILYHGHIAHFPLLFNAWARLFKTNDVAG